MEVICESCGRPYKGGGDCDSGKLCSVCRIGSANDTNGNAENIPQPTRSGDQTKESLSFFEVAHLFPDFEFLEVIGQGGMGTVYRAIQRSLGRTVALKMLRKDLSENPEFQERFEREARMMADLVHPNLVAIYDYGDREGRQYLVMEFIEGLNLQQLMQTGKYTTEDALRLIPQICNAVHHLHTKGHVHRDLKPANILIDKEGTVKVADFGLAKVPGDREDFTLTREEIGMGTPYYVAPEQRADARNSTPKSDIFSLGVIFHEMLTGQLPTGNADSPMGIGTRKVRKLIRTIHDALSPDPGRRPKCALCFVEALSSDAPGSSRQGGRKRLWVGCVTVGGMVAAVALGLTMVEQPRQERSVFAVNRTDQGIPSKQVPEITIQDLEEKFLIDLPDIGLPAGPLMNWKASRPEKFERIKPELDDFVELDVSHFFIHTFYGFRADLTVACFNPAPGMRNSRLATRSFFVTSGNRILRRNEPNGDVTLDFKSPSSLSEQVRTIEQGSHFAIVLTKDNKARIASTSALWEKWGTLFTDIESEADVIDAAAWSDTGIVLFRDGKPICWNARLGRIEKGIPPVPLVDVDCGVSHFVGRDSAGNLYVWPVDEDSSDPKARMAVAVPEDALHNIVRIEVDLHITAVQKADGSWRAWGDDHGSGLIDVVRRIGPVRDLAIRAFPPEATELIWIASPASGSSER